MRIFFEGETYNIDLLKSIFNGKFYSINKNIGTIDSVGFFYGSDNQINYLLPKIFIDQNGFFLKNYHKDALIINDFEKVLVASELKWLNKFLIFFYKSLSIYKDRFNSNILQSNNTLQLNTTFDDNYISFLDIVLSFVNFHKMNKNNILYIHKTKISSNHKKNINWNKTINKSSPFITTSGTPLYFEFFSTKKFIDSEEILFCMFYSVLNHFNSNFHFFIQIDKSFNLYTGTSFDKLNLNALKILKRIRHKYYSDVSVKMYKLLEIYFSHSNSASFFHKKEEYIMVKYYHLIFEDMIDKLLTNQFEYVESNDGLSLKKMKHNKDGKIIDHLFQHDSLIDRNEKIFYIGDSKYYKNLNNINKESIFKQFTYAKNIIQFNIDLLNENKLNDIAVRYRDEITEGYNLTPNFFIQGILPDDLNFDSDGLILDSNKPVHHSYHFKERLFDRDSLFINYYSINFLYILKNYCISDFNTLNNQRSRIYEYFRSNFIGFLKNSSFIFLQSDFETVTLLKKFIDNEYKQLIGRIYITKLNNKRLILALNSEDIILNNFFSGLEYRSENYLDGVVFSYYQFD